MGGCCEESLSTEEHTMARRHASRNEGGVNTKAASKPALSGAAAHTQSEPPPNARRSHSVESNEALSQMAVGLRRAAPLQLDEDAAIVQPVQRTPGQGVRHQRQPHALIRAAGGCDGPPSQAR